MTALTSLRRRSRSTTGTFGNSRFSTSGTGESRARTRRDDPLGKSGSAGVSLQRNSTFECAFEIDGLETAHPGLHRRPIRLSRFPVGGSDCAAAFGMELDPGFPQAVGALVGEDVR